MAIQSGWRQVCITACLVFASIHSLVSSAAEAVFYQPLNRDQTLSKTQWQQIGQQMQQQQLHTLIVQWSSYGEQSFLQPDSPLQQLLTSLPKPHPQLWLGLKADAAEFREKRDALQRKAYLQQQLAANATYLAALASQTLPVAPTGWYLPLEFYDIDLQSDADAHWLKQQLQQLRAHSTLPVAISFFSNGTVAPVLFKQRLASLQQQGLQIWLQDGGGAGLLSPALRAELLHGLDCQLGVIVEAFRQADYGSSFSARAASPAELAQARADIAPCHAISYFSLRYLDVSQQWLPLRD